MKKIDGIILSKDRACQLDLLLRSIAKNFKEVSRLKVLYRASNDKYMEAYNKLIAKDLSLDVEYILEESFKVDYKNILSGLNEQYIINFCDDNTVITAESVDFMVEQLENDQAVCTASLRLNPKYNYCQPANKTIAIPEFIERDNFLKWDWTKYDPFTCWGYPHPIDNNIYRMGYFKNLIAKCPLKTPCIEIEICTMRDMTKPFMVSLLNTKIITITNNRANAWGQNKTYGKQEYSLENLNNIYLRGQVIDLENIMEYYNKTELKSGHVFYDWRYTSA